MNSKQMILSLLSCSGAEEYPMPDLSAIEKAAVRYDDVYDAFCKAITASGGKVVTKAPAPSEDEFTVKASFGVAENGCVWISEDAFVDRRDLFIHDRLTVRLEKSELVNNMHEAYARIGEGPLKYGIFISGPSKTADIEQALVFGAHGPREMYVVAE